MDQNWSLQCYQLEAVLGERDRRTDNGPILQFASMKHILLPALVQGVFILVMALVLCVMCIGFQHPGRCFPDGRLIAGIDTVAGQEDIVPGVGQQHINPFRKGTRIIQ